MNLQIVIPAYNEEEAIQHGNADAAGVLPAAQVNPEVLLIDEVLAVGDLGFQRKCIRRLGELERSRLHHRDRHPQ